MQLKGRSAPREGAPGFPHAVVHRCPRQGKTRIFGPRPSTAELRGAPTIVSPSEGRSTGSGGPVGSRCRRGEPPARHRSAPYSSGAIAHARRVRHFRVSVAVPGRRCLETALQRGSDPVRRRGRARARGGGVGLGVLVEGLRDGVGIVGWRALERMGG